MQYKLPFLIEAPPEPTADSTHTHTGRLRWINLAGRMMSYSFRRSSRRTIGLVIDERGLQAAAPKWAPIAEVEAFIREKEHWILKHLHHSRPQRPSFLWHVGARLPFLGREIFLHCRDDDCVQAVQLRGDRLEVGSRSATPYALRETVLAWLKSEALALYRARIAALAPRLDVPLPEVGLSQARTQWGSCTRKRDGRTRILLNWKLIHFELPLIDYVAAHELAHLRHMNHSPAFWSEVAKLYPDFREAREALRQRGHLIPEL